MATTRYQPVTLESSILFKSLVIPFFDIVAVGAAPTLDAEEPTASPELLILHTILLDELGKPTPINCGLSPDTIVATEVKNMFEAL
ncbi:hypothetical protein MKFW12EY_45090 (plasmid) [Methylomonas koyamae]|nr:hypothetical protein MKFW12EY_45090 [Methylomonas koyamae]